MASAGRRTPSSTTSHCTEARIESLPSMGVAVNPAVDVGTRNPRTAPAPAPNSPAGSSTRAHTTATSASDASPIQRFAPSSTHPSPSRRATVVMAAGSLPPCGSVSAKHPTSSPAAMPGSQRSFCSSEPYLWMALIASDPCTDTNVRQPLSAASSSRHTSPYATAPAPAHP